MPSEAALYISQYGYIAIFVLIFLQEIGVPNPVPNELVLLFSGYLVFTGVLFLPFVLVTAIAADILGATILYYVFYFFGGYILSHKPKWLPISTEKINKLSQKINAGGLGPVFWGRITPFIRGYVSVISGLVQIKPKLYLPLIFITAALVCGTYVILGRLLGPYWGTVGFEVLKLKYYLLAAALTIVILALIINYKRNKNKELVEAENAAVIAHGAPLVLKVHIVSETAWVAKGQGVHTAFLNLIELLGEKDDIEVVINGEGWGDVFHSHTYGPYYFWKGIRYKGCRIHTVHVIPDSIKGSLPMWKNLLPLAKSYFKMAFSYADILIALSPMVERAIKELGVKTPIVKIYNPILVEHWRRTTENRRKGRELLGIGENELIILGVGQLQERKGVEDFIDIGKAIPDAKFVWVGGRPFGVFTEGINRINNGIEGAPENVSFAGMFDLQDMPSIYAAADIFLFPSYQENCPLAPLEAAASQMPVIYRDLKEYALLYDNPYLKAANNEDFISLTKKLIKDKDFYSGALKISACLLKQFDKNKIRADIVDLYHKVYCKHNVKVSCKPNFKDN